MRELALNNCRIDKRYDIREQLGRGSYAEIFLATDTIASPQSPHHSVVLKALNVFLQDDVDTDLERTLVENFQIEAAALDRVRHPNIISRLGHGTARDLAGTIFHYLVLEYLPGGDLQSAIRKREIQMPNALGYIEQICAGLGHAHYRGVIHRDIKPQNLLLSADLTTVKIADFGVARISTADSPITRVGTNIYAPPEHSPAVSELENVGSKLTPAADIYSLAKSAYALITREVPRAFAGAPILSLPDGYMDEDWSEPLIKALRRATADDPKERPQSAEEFWYDLGDVRDIVAQAETDTVVHWKHDAPQPHVSRGYSPLVPAQPSFELVTDTGRRDPVRNSAAAPSGDAASAVIEFPAYVPAKTPMAPPPRVRPSEVPVPVPVRRRSRALRRLAIFVIFAIAFTGVLYGTARYVRSTNWFASVRNMLVDRSAVANTDIYLRPSPNTDNDPIGLVTKNSRVRIVNSQNNWYQVDVVEQGRVRNGGPSATRGWLNGKYIDLDEN